MDDQFTDRAEEYAALVDLEQAFLDHVTDDEIHRAYVAAQKGDAGAFRQLTLIAKEGWQAGGATPRQAKADRAIQMIYWFRMATH